MLFGRAQAALGVSVCPPYPLLAKVSLLSYPHILGFLRSPELARKPSAQADLRGVRDYVEREGSPRCLWNVFM